MNIISVKIYNVIDFFYQKNLKKLWSFLKKYFTNFNKLRQKCIPSAKLYKFTPNVK